MNNRGLLLAFIVFMAHEGILISKNNEARNFSFYKAQALETPLAQYKHIPSAAWCKQVAKQITGLNEEDFLRKPIVIKQSAYPVKFVEIGQNTYLVSKDFGNTKNALSADRYELYFMPNEKLVGDVFRTIIKALKENPAINTYIDFVALRVKNDRRLKSHSSYSHRKILPIILVRLNDSATQEDARRVLTVLYNATNGYKGSGIHPRYSSSLTGAKNNLIYTAFGSGDAKELHPDQFEHKGPRFWRAADDMAYKKGMTPLSLKE